MSKLDRACGDPAILVRRLLAARGRGSLTGRAQLFLVVALIFAGAFAPQPALGPGSELVLARRLSSCRS